MVVDAHWDRALAIEVQQRPLRSGAGEEARRREGEEEKRRKKARRAMLKSNKPHLAGGEKMHDSTAKQDMFSIP